MVFETTLTVMALILGIAFLAYCSHKAVEYSVKLASTLGVSPLMVGLVVVSLGTDLPEISNSIVSSILGHGDINVGDSFGSVLAQISLVLGIFPFLGGRFRVRRDEVVVIGACEVLALIASVSMVEKGYISRLNGVFMVTRSTPSSLCQLCYTFTSTSLASSCWPLERLFQNWLST